MNEIDIAERRTPGVVLISAILVLEGIKVHKS